MRSQEAVNPFVNAVPATVLFEVRGGRYAISYNGTGTGTVDIKALGPDGVTYIACGVTQITATVGYQVVELAPGNYEAIIATFTANYLRLVRIPGD